MISREIRPLRAVAHPAFFAGLVLLVLNDRVFKGSGLLPGWLTGKLSDFAGVFVAAVLFSAIVRARTSRGVLLAHAAVGIGFALVKTSPGIVAVVDAVYRLVGAHWTTLVDPTDLMALAILPLGHWYTVRVGARESSRIRSVAASTLAPIAVIACAASTNNPYVEQSLPTSAPPCDPGSPAVDPYNSYYTSSAACPDSRVEDVCNDGVDNDRNGLIDCEDPACETVCADIANACMHGSFAPAMLHIETTTSLDGDTTHGSNVSAGSCVGADAPEVIYQLVSQHAGTLTIGVPANHGVYIRNECINESSEIACNDGSKPNGTISVPVLNGAPITIVVDALDALHPGAFHVPLSFQPAGCGDGVRQDPEECDDGLANGTPTDGCSANCTAVPAVLCQSFPTAMLGQTPGDFQHGTKSFVGSCVGTFDSPEQGYRYVPSSTSVTVSVASTATVGVYGRNGPCPGTTSLGCSVGNPQFGPPSIKMATQPGQEITFFVELEPGEPVTSTYTMTVTEP